MSINSLIKSIRVGLSSKLFVCVVTILAGYSYSYIDTPFLRLLSILVLLVSAEAMVLLWGNFFLGNMFEGLKIIFKRGYSISWVEMPELIELAKQMGVKLHQKRPFGIKKDLNNAYANSLTRQIIVGEALIQKLGTQELLALAGHELTHLKKDHYGKVLTWLIVVYLLASLSLSFATAPAIVKNLIYTAAFVITFVFISHKNEYDADTGAARQIGKEPTISLLQSIVPHEQWQHESETHPSIRDRISKLQKM